jgi:uncharacterized membrane protein YjgN (DUF898 family)
MHMAQLYKVIFRGQRVPGWTDEQVREKLLALGFKEAQSATLVAGRGATIKRQLVLAQAELYQRRLHDAGILVDIQAETLELSLVAIDEPDAEPVVERPVAEPAAASLTAEAPRFQASEPTRRPDEDYASRRRQEPVEFSGDGREYFGIWIVNIFLMIVTLGFYAPWAKVRNNQYFYGHTQIDGASFQYLADPWVIFRGRLVAVVLALVWAVISHLWMGGAVVLMLLFLPALPWIICRALKFHMVNSAYRNIRFDFKGSYTDACMATLVWPLVSLLTLFLAFPLALFKSHSFVINNSYFGTMPFRLKASATDYYMFFLRVVVFLVGCFVVAAVAGAIFNPVFSGLVMLLGYLALFGYFMAGLTNLMMNSTVLGMHGFESTLGKRQMVWIFMTNSLLIALTLGLYTPWAKVRMARYRASCTQVNVHGDLDGFIAGETERTSAMGQEIGEAFDVGISLI